MLVLGLLITLTAFALPSIYVTSLNLTRCATLIFLSTGVIAMNGKNIQAMGSGVSISAGLLEKTSTIQAIDFILSAAAFLGQILIYYLIIGLVIFLPFFNETVKNCIKDICKALALFVIICLFIYYYHYFIYYYDYFIIVVSYIVLVFIFIKAVIFMTADTLNFKIKNIIPNKRVRALIITIIIIICLINMNILPILECSCDCFPTPRTGFFQSVRSIIGNVFHLNPTSNPVDIEMGLITNELLQQSQNANTQYHQFINSIRVDPRLDPQLLDYVTDFVDFMDRTHPHLVYGGNHTYFTAEFNPQAPMVIPARGSSLITR